MNHLHRTEQTILLPEQACLIVGWTEHLGKLVRLEHERTGLLVFL